MSTSAEKRNGFTIIELLIATVVIAVGILAWGKTLDGSIKGRAISNGITTASTLALAELERTALLLYERKTVSSATLPVIPMNGVNYTITRTVMEGKRVGQSLANIDIVDVDVSWNHYGSKSLSYRRIVTGG